MANDDKITLLGFWASLYGMRVRVALAEKGVEYEYIEQDLMNKSELLLKMNPVHKKIPVLIHNDKPICESLNIVEYIDEVWNDKSPLLPSHPYQRAQARFWADFIDKKIYESVRKITWSPEEEVETIKKEMIQHFKVLEEQLGDKPYFNGDTFGFVDVTLIPFFSVYYALENTADFKLNESSPKIIGWAKRCLSRESVAKSLPDGKKLFEFICELKKKFSV